MKYISPSLQWLLFIISGNLVIPLAIAEAYELPMDQTVDFVARTFFVLATIGLIQIKFGHRLPIHEGPSGLWWGIFTLYANIGVFIYGSLEQTLRVLEFSLLISGGICILLSVLGIIEKIYRYFTPAVTGTYLILLVTQLSSSFFTGLLGISHTGELSYPIMFASLFIIIIAIATTRHPILNHFSIIISMLVGFCLFYMLGYTAPFNPPKQLVSVPTPFAFGLPFIHWAILPTTFFITLFLIMNMLASMKLVAGTLTTPNSKAAAGAEKKAGIALGIGQGMAGLFSTVGSVPVSGAAGFIETSKIISKIPFIIASIIIICMSMIQPIISLLATIPAAVGYAAIFPIFSSMLTLGFKQLFTSTDPKKTIQKVGIPLFTGVGLMYIPAEAYIDLPPIFATILSNGLVMGTLLIIAIEVFNQRNGKTDSLAKNLT